MVGTVTTGTNYRYDPIKGSYNTLIHVNSPNTISVGQSIHIEGNVNSFDVDVSFIEDHQGDPQNSVTGDCDATIYWKERKIAHAGDLISESSVVLTGTIISPSVPNLRVTVIQVPAGQSMSVENVLLIVGPIFSFSVVVEQMELAGSPVNTVNGPCQVHVYWSLPRNASSGDIVTIMPSQDMEIPQK